MRPAYEERRWSNGEHSKGKAAAAHDLNHDGMRFRFMSWNLLADDLATTHRAELYPRVPQAALEWHRRWRLATKEVRHLLPDVVCLQEVDKWDDVRQALAELGYQGSYLQRTGGRTDGCATFWHTSKFKQHSVVPIRFQDHDMRDNVALIVLLEPLPGAQQTPAEQQQQQLQPRQDKQQAQQQKQQQQQKGQGQQSKDKSGRRQPCTTTSEDASSGVEDNGDRAERLRRCKEQELQTQELQQQSNDDKRSRAHALRSPGTSHPHATKRQRPASLTDAHVLDAPATGAAAAGTSHAAECAAAPLLAVGNTHVLFNIKRGDIKLGQLRVLLQSMADVAQQKAPRRAVLNIATGDFNSAPHSPLYQFVTNGQLDCLQQDRRFMAGVIQGTHRQTTIDYSGSSAAVAGKGQQYQQQQAGRHQRWDDQGKLVRGPMPWQQQQQHQHQHLHQQHQQQPQQQQQQQQQGWHAVASVLHEGIQDQWQQQARHQQRLDSYQEALAAELDAAGGSVKLHAEHHVLHVQQQGGSIAMEVDVESVTVQQQQQQQQQSRRLTQEMLRASGWSGEHLLTATGGVPVQQQGPQQQQEGQGLPPHPQLPQPQQQHLPTAQAGGQQHHEQEQGWQRQQEHQAHGRPDMEEEEGQLPDDAPFGTSGLDPEEQQQSDDRMARSRHNAAGAAIKNAREARRAAGKDAQRAADARRALEQLGDGIARHPLRLASAYMEVTGSEPSFTSVHDKFHGTLDYIMFDKEPAAAENSSQAWQLRPLSVLHPPPRQHITHLLPSLTLPSDHISLVCDFELLPVAGGHGKQPRTRRQG